MPWSASKGEDASAELPQTSAMSAPQPTKPFVVPTDIVATVNGAPISKQDVELRLDELRTLMVSLGQTWEPLAVEAPERELSLSTVLEELVSTEVLSQDAAARGLGRDVETTRRWEYLRRGFYAQEWLRWYQARHEITSEEITQHYEEFKLGYREPERLRLRQLTVPSEEQAKRVVVQLYEGVAFEDLARQVSVGPHAQAGGAVPGWIMREDERAAFAPDDADVTALDPVLESAAFAIDEPGRISNYVRGPDGRFYVFQLIERQAGRQRAIADVWDEIKTLLAVQKVSEGIDELRASMRIERFPERLEGVAQ